MEKKSLGLDIGTTTISLVIYGECQGALDSLTLPNGTFIPGEPWERLQDPGVILARAQDGVKELLKRHPDVTAIGVTGQMHGILYLDREGRAVSPLYTWQDGRGDRLCDRGESWTQKLSRITGYPLATGFGIVTHYYNLCNGLVPENAVTFCTIGAYAAMKLAGLTAPALDASDAASFGMYDWKAQGFDMEAAEKAGINPVFLPKIAARPCLGVGEAGIPVYTALGDNQASFLGATEGRTDALLINVGTGSQISLYSPDYLDTGTLEPRPFPDGGWILVGASLCGGRSYAMLEQFFRETVRMVTGEEVSAYGAMSRVKLPPENLPSVDTRFQGTRQEPQIRGEIGNLDIHNFTPAHLIWGFMQGMARELFEMYEGYLRKEGKKPTVIIGSGNGLRKNPQLCRAFEQIFGCPVQLARNLEEAACGAALFTMKHTHG